MPEAWVWFDFTSPLSFAVHDAARTRWSERSIAWRWEPFEQEPELVLPGRPRSLSECNLGTRDAAAFADLNLPFKPSKLLPNTQLALRAHIWCEAHSPTAADDLRDGAFRRLYERGLENHLWDAEVLAGLVERAGLDPIAFLEDMKDGACSAELATRRRHAADRGIRGTPTLRSASIVLGPDAPWKDLCQALER